jgi:hypothetical protein
MKRQLNSSIQNELLTSNLWIHKLEEDCKAQKVFLAIRNNTIDFYYKGSKLFGFDKNFATHKKFASVIESKGDYLKESDLSKCKILSDFETGYSRIKENCSNYSGEESNGVSEIYHKHSYLSKSDIVVLDIEVSFESLSDKSKQDRIDIVLFNKKTKTLQFVEAKHFSNSEIWSMGTPKVIGQIQKYEDQIAENKHLILSEYDRYIKIINELFHITLPEPANIESKVILLIFGFDSNQRDGRLKELITTNSEYKAKKVYTIGDIKGINLENLWKVKEL